MPLPSELLREVCVVIQNTGYIGDAESYVQEFYGKSFDELNICEAELIIRTLKDKPGCLYEGNPEDLKPKADDE